MMKRYIVVLLLFHFSTVYAFGRINVFTEGKFRYKVMGYCGDMEVTDSAAYIIGVDRSVLTGSFWGKELVIPATVVHNGYRYKVEGINYNAFAQCDDVERIVIGNGIKRIEDGAFMDCYNLQSVFIPKSVNVISNPFTSCPNLKEIVVDEENPDYDSRENCNAIIRKKDNSLVCGCYTTKIPKNVERIEQDAFYGCWKLEHVTLPEGIEEIACDAFSRCINLRSVRLPRSLKILGERVFGYCSCLTAVHIPENVSVIEEENGLFAGCYSLDTITVDSRNIVFDSRNGCNAVIRTSDNILIAGCGRTVIPADVKEIGESAFFDTTIRDIHIPASVTHIQPGAFRGVKCCTSIYVDEKNPVYDSRNGCNAIMETVTNKLVAGCISTIIPEKTRVIGESAFSYMKLPPVVVIPEGVEKIEEGAFCRAEFDKVVIPASVESVDGCAFDGCTLNQVCWNGHVDVISSFSFAYCKNLRAVYVPEGTKVIDRFAFWRCKNLSIVSLPKSLEAIEYSAFRESLCEENVKRIKADIIHEPEITCPVCRSYYQNDEP